MYVSKIKISYNKEESSMATRYLEGEGIFLSPIEETDVSVLLKMQNENSFGT